MSNPLLSILSGQATSTISNFPVGSSVKVGPQAVFGKVFNGIFSAFTNNSTFNGAGSQLLGGTAGINGGINPQALQAYNIAQASGTVPQQFLQAQALAPGSSIIGGQVQPPSIQSSIVNNLGLASTLQGGTGTTNFNPNGQQLPQGPIGFPGFGLPSGGGKLQMLLYPVLGLVSAFKSIFGIRKIMSAGLQPVKVHKENLAYNQTNKNISEFEHEEGSFDEYIYPQEESQSGSSIQQLTDF